MKIEVTTYGVKIHAETAQDSIYISRLLGLKKVGDSCKCSLQSASSGKRYIDIRPSGEETEV